MLSVAVAAWKENIFESNEIEFIFLKILTSLQFSYDYTELIWIHNIFALFLKILSTPANQEEGFLFSV